MIWRFSAIALFEKAVKHKPGFLKKPGLLCYEETGFIVCISGQGYGERKEVRSHSNFNLVC
ncbi:hypothetical protein [Aerosakkonema funiforme]|uniref:hypothetical protein n=1 Tax=Aerosakkonema funiforme TaxID=1246630 RepID=UPI0035B8BB20